MVTPVGQSLSWTRVLNVPVYSDFLSHCVIVYWFVYGQQSQAILPTVDQRYVFISRNTLDDRWAERVVMGNVQIYEKSNERCETAWRRG